MPWIVFLPIAIGAITVVQGGLNRQVTDHWGLAGAILINNIAFFGAGALIYVFARYFPTAVPEIFRERNPFLQGFRWWYLVPGVFGVCIVGGIPWAITRMGALKAFMGIIAAQLIVGIIWDAMVEQTPATMLRVAGAVLAFIGACMVMWH